MLYVFIITAYQNINKKYSKKEKFIINKKKIFLCDNFCFFLDHHSFFMYPSVVCLPEAPEEKKRES